MREDGPEKATRGSDAPLQENILFETPFCGRDTMELFDDFLMDHDPFDRDDGFLALDDDDDGRVADEHRGVRGTLPEHFSVSKERDSKDDCSGGGGKTNLFVFFGLKPAQPVSRKGAGLRCLKK